MYGRRRKCIANFNCYPVYAYVIVHCICVIRLTSTNKHMRLINYFDQTEEKTFIKYAYISFTVKLIQE